ncbi:biotin synthase BioB [Luteococcus peritonei]|uniref:Biotin synthase n=1 Tax=Luteococcus peritonei TaxID=88874 RepID=A0ABW4RXA3_9ACTN
MDLDLMTHTALRGESITREQALQVLQAPDAMTLSVVAAAGTVRRHFFGNQVLVNHLVNIKSGMCPEDCSYCSQALDSTAGILRYSWLPREQIEEAVRAGLAQGASTVCLVASGRGPSRREVEMVAGIVEELKAEHPEVTVCTCLGFLDEPKAERLKQAGSDRYNHNLNTAEDRYGEICSTHSYSDRAETVAHARSAGMDACSGLIAGMGESDEQLVDVVFSLRELGVESVPVNFLLPFEGTPLEAHRELNPLRCLRILAMVRLVHPDVEVRSAAGREYHLRSLQPLALEVCNSIFLGDYLTSEGQAGGADLEMIRDAGFEIKGRVDSTVLAGPHGTPSVAVRSCGQGGAESGCGGCGSQGGCGDGHAHQAEPDDEPRVDAAGVPIRRRGAGAAQPA